MKGYNVFRGIEIRNSLHSIIILFFCYTVTLIFVPNNFKRTLFKLKALQECSSNRIFVPEIICYELITALLIV